MQRMRPQAKRWWPLASLLKITPHSPPVPHCLSCPSPRRPSSVLQILPGGFSRPLQLPFPIPMALVHGPDHCGPSYQQANTHYEKLGIFPDPSTFIPSCMLGSTRTADRCRCVWFSVQAKSFLLITVYMAGTGLPRIHSLESWRRGQCPWWTSKVIRAWERPVRSVVPGAEVPHAPPRTTIFWVPPSPNVQLSAISTSDNGNLGISQTVLRFL